MKRTLAAWTALACCVLSPTASAYPSMRAQAAGSALFIYLSNPEDRPYSCTITYSWAHDSFGEKIEKSESFQVSVPAKANEFQAHKNSGSYVNMRFTAGPSMQCNPN